MMIPEIIHYCWFGSAAIPAKQQQYIKDWHRIMPGFTIICWNENNSPMHLPYMQNALVNKKWANLSNLTRLHALDTYGGIYLDTDIEVLQSFQPLLDQSFFLGFEDKYIDWDGCVNNAVIGASPQHWFIKKMHDALIAGFDGSEEAHLSSPNLTTALLKSIGLQAYKDQYIDDIHLYTTEYFYPYSWHELFDPRRITKNTYCIHRFQQSWRSAKPKLADIKRSAKSMYYNLQWQLVKRRFKK